MSAASRPARAAARRTTSLLALLCAVAIAMAPHVPGSAAAETSDPCAPASDPSLEEVVEPDPGEESEDPQAECCSPAPDPGDADSPPEGEGDGGEEQEDGDADADGDGSGDGVDDGLPACPGDAADPEEPGTEDDADGDAEDPEAEDPEGSTPDEDSAPSDDPAAPDLTAPDAGATPPALPRPEPRPPALPDDPTPDDPPPAEEGAAGGEDRLGGPELVTPEGRAGSTQAASGTARPRPVAPSGSAGPTPGRDEGAPGGGVAGSRSLTSLEDGGDAADGEIDALTPDVAGAEGLGTAGVQGEPLEVAPPRAAAARPPAPPSPSQLSIDRSGAQGASDRAAAELALGLLLGLLGGSLALAFRPARLRTAPPVEPWRRGGTPLSPDRPLSSEGAREPTRRAPRAR